MGALPALRCSFGGNGSQVTTGAEARTDFCLLDAALKAPLFHVTTGGAAVSICLDLIRKRRGGLIASKG
jgi:hypothetical protein